MNPDWTSIDGAVQLCVGDCRQHLARLPEQSVHCCVTSPPYWGLRDYGVDGQIGLEQAPDEYVAEMVAVFRAVRRVLRDDGTLWLNLGDGYAANSTQPKTQNGFPGNRSLKQRAVCSSTAFRGDGIKGKDLIGMPWAVAFALRADGWYLRQDIIWHKPNPMPESVADRCTKAHEYVFLLSKSPRYYYDADAIKEPGSPTAHGGRVEADGNGNKHRISGAHHTGLSRSLGGKAGESGRNRRSVWTIPTQPYAGAHFATFPPKLIEPCILAGCPEGGTVLDPFLGSGTTAEVARRLGRKCIGVELSSEYVGLIRKRLEQGELFAACHEQLTTDN